MPYWRMYCHLIWTTKHREPIMTGKIAWAHLKEMPDYYERLERIEREASWSV